MQTLLALPMELRENLLTLGVYKPEGMHAVSVHLAVTLRHADIRIEPGQHVSRLGSPREEIEGQVWILNVRGRRRLVGMHEVGEFYRVTDEEDRLVDAGN